MEAQNRIAVLILKQLKGEIDSREADELKEWINYSEENRLLFRQLTDPTRLQTEFGAFYQSRTKILNKINEAISVPKAVSLWKKIAVAASIIITVGVGGYFYFAGKNQNQVVRSTPQKQLDIQPAKNGAILTLDNGQQIVLDSANNGTLAKQGNSKIIKQGDHLSYSSNQQDSASEIIYNTITTPKGRQYPNLTLGDGTKVWLDAGSSIRFPVAFTRNERKVEITGQVWFDVVHNSKIPFKVIAKNVEVNDLGTEFNVNAYDDEQQIHVTLLQGAISIGRTTLKPGQQAQITNNGKLQLMSSVDIEEVMAWKNGFFSFRQTDIKGIMRQLSRWYDVEVRYENVNPAETFTGEIDRNLNLAEVLKILEKTRVHFRIEEGRKLVILP